MSLFRLGFMIKTAEGEEGERGRGRERVLPSDGSRWIGMMEG